MAFRYQRGRSRQGVCRCSKTHMYFDMRAFRDQARLLAKFIDGLDSLDSGWL